MIFSKLTSDAELILDASLFLAAISPGELHHPHALALYDSVPDSQPFLVPSLFRLEVLAALARRRESTELLDTVDAVVSGPRFHTVTLEAPLLERSVAIARAARLRAYDAVYAALALERGAALLTLDRELCAKLDGAFPEAVLITLM